MRKWSDIIIDCYDLSNGFDDTGSAGSTKESAQKGSGLLSELTSLNLKQTNVSANQPEEKEVPSESELFAALDCNLVKSMQGAFIRRLMADRSINNAVSNVIEEIVRQIKAAPDLEHLSAPHVAFGWRKDSHGNGVYLIDLTAIELKYVACVLRHYGFTVTKNNAQELYQCSLFFNPFPGPLQ